MLTLQEEVAGAIARAVCAQLEMEGTRE